MKGRGGEKKLLKKHGHDFGRSLLSILSVRVCFPFSLGLFLPDIPFFGCDVDFDSPRPHVTYPTPTLLKVQPTLKQKKIQKKEENVNRI